MDKVIQYSWLIPALPLLGFLLTGLLRNHLSKGISSFIGSTVILLSFVLSIMIFSNVASGDLQTVKYFTLINTGGLDINFAFKIDQLSSLFLLIITGVGFLIHIYSAAYMHEENSRDFSKYFSFLNLFVFSMLLLVMGGNFLIMFIGWEGVGLCSYLLIGYWFTNNNYTAAAKKAFVMNRIGDLGFLLALFWLISKIGSLDYDVVFTQASLAKLSSFDITGITLLLFVGATGKSAQIPLYTWLPDAMAGPTPVSALIHAATMVTAGIYMIARSNALYSLSPMVNMIISVIGLATALLAATIALKQNDIKKVLAYSTVSQLGYMFLALGAGAYTAAVFHVMTHAFFKALLFLGAGSVIHALHHEQDMRRMGGLKKFLPITHLTMLIGCLAIAGIPPFSGFFSKDEILAHAYAANPILWIGGAITALLTAFYMFRMYAMTFLGKYRGGHDDHGHDSHTPHESPIQITVPLIVLAILATLAGFLGIPEIFKPHAHQLENFLAPVFAGATKHGHTISHSTEWMLMGISVALAVAGILIAIRTYKNYSATDTRHPSPVTRLLENKWYVDELYDAIISKPLKKLSLFFNNMIEKKGIDGVVNGTGKFVDYGSRQLRSLQSGQVGLYVMFMVIGMILLFVIQFYFKS